MDRYCLDACALIAFLNDEDGSDKVDDLLDKAETPPQRLMCNSYSNS
ncbi:hypothetical protein FACS189493_1200 [Spirochaetia bacterium]|nr:hypothetical protein FACS189493_1200 [Spirochaetia bacterium]